MLLVDVHVLIVALAAAVFEVLALHIHLVGLLLPLLSLPFLFALLLVSPGLLELLLLPLLFLLDLEVVLHLLDDVALAVTLVVDAGFLVQEGVLVVWVQHFLKQFLTFLKVAILDNLVRFVAEPEKQACKQK